MILFRYRNSIQLFALLIFIIFTSIGIAENKYQKEVIFEIYAGDNALPLSISAQMDSPFPKPNNKIDGPVINNPLFFNNKSNIILIDHIDDYNVITDYNIIAGTKLVFSPAADPLINNLHNLKLGPNDEMYIEWVSSHLRRKDKVRKLAKYIKTDSSYIEDITFVSGEQNSPFRDLNISPNGFLYYKNSGKGIKPDEKYTLLNSNGQQIDKLNAVCNTSAGLKFVIKYLTGTFEIIDSDTKSIISQHVVNDSYGYRFLSSTASDQVILSVNCGENIPLADDKYLIIRTPLILVFNMETGQTDEIATAVCMNTDYRFYNVDRVSSNFNGDIFAAVIYFNNPGELIGDEKITFYRWRLK